MIDIIALIIAGLSLIVSTWVAKIQYSQQKSIHNASLNSKYHDEIFLEHLIRGIPESRKYIRFNNETGRLDDTKKFTDELNEMLGGALYYKYNDNDFYKKLKEMVQEIEDYVMDCGNEKFEQEEQSEVYNSIQEKLEKMYKLINDQYIGKSNKKGCLFLRK